MSTVFLPVCSTSWPGPWPRTSAEGEYTRRNSNGRRNTLPSENAISMARERWCSLISVGWGASTAVPLRAEDLVGDALEVVAALDELGELDAYRTIHEHLDHPAGLEPAHREHQAGRR